MDFTTMDINTINTGVTADGVRYLSLFLKEYTSIFSETVNPGCSKCMSNYHTKYINHMKKSENTSGYRLKAKYENIPLAFGSPILVNNGNIDKYGEQLLKNHPHGKDLFDAVPDGAGSDIQEQHAILKDKVIKAENKLNSLPADASEKAKKGAEKTHKKALDALSDFENENNLINQEQANEIEVTLSADDLTANPELSGAGFNEGDVVIIDQKELDENGTIHVLRRKE